MDDLNTWLDTQYAAWYAVTDLDEQYEDDDNGQS